MDDFKQWAHDYLVWLIMDPRVLIPFGLAVVVFVFFSIVFIIIKIKDVSGAVKPKTKAIDLVRSGEIPGVRWPEPRVGPGPSMIVEPSRPRANVTKIVFLKNTKGLEDRGIDLDRFVSSVNIGDTQPIEVTRDGEAQRIEPEEHAQRTGEAKRNVRKSRGSRQRGPQGRNRRSHRADES